MSTTRPSVFRGPAPLTSAASWRRDNALPPVEALPATRPWPLPTTQTLLAQIEGSRRRQSAVRRRTGLILFAAGVVVGFALTWWGLR
jgi:hypothetical protein